MVTDSGIDTVGVLTQYRPLLLNTHIGIGSHWDLNRRNGGLAILPPYMNEKEGNWYKGTADAIYQNMSYIDSYDPEYVLILSGDHIYKMDYSDMLEEQLSHFLRTNYHEGLTKDHIVLIKNILNL